MLLSIPDRREWPDNFHAFGTHEFTNQLNSHVRLVCSDKVSGASGTLHQFKLGPHLIRDSKLFRHAQEVGATQTSLRNCDYFGSEHRLLKCFDRGDVRFNSAGPHSKALQINVFLRSE